MGDVARFRGCYSLSDLSKRKGVARENPVEREATISTYQVVKCLGRGKYEMVSLDNDKKTDSKETESKETDSKETDSEAADASTNESKQNEAGEDTSEQKVVETFGWSPAIPALQPEAITHSGDVMTSTDGSHILYINLDALPDYITDLYFVLSAYNCGDLGKFKQPSVHLFDADNPTHQLCMYDLNQVNSPTARKISSLHPNPTPHTHTQSLLDKWIHLTHAACHFTICR